MSWYPKTAEDVMKLPVGSALKYLEIDCPRCHTHIHVPQARKTSPQVQRSDMVFIAIAPDGNWAPFFDEEDGWMRRRV